VGPFRGFQLEDVIDRVDSVTGPSRWKALAALAVVWIGLGGVFVAGKVGVSAYPPFVFAAPRFLIAGALILAWSAWRSPGGLRLTRRELLEAVAIGLATIAAGQGSAMWTLSQLPSGLVAVLTGTMPLWLAVFTIVFLRVRIPALALAGLAVSFAGVCFLASPSGAGIRALPLVVITLGMAGWAAGALLASRSQVVRRPLVLAGIQMLVGGAAQVVFALILREPAGLTWTAAFTAPIAGAFVYSLIVASAGFVAYAWLLGNTPPMVANSNAYVSPVVALIGVWLVLGEPLGARTVAAAGVTLAGVALLIWARDRRRAAGPLVEEERQAAAA
jgi:drug/metabolite transporter (DMT)-like permease